MKREEIEHLATLARIKLSNAEADRLAEEVGAVLGYVSAVSDISATEKEKVAKGLHNVTRKDEPNHEPGEYTEALLAAAPDRDGRYVKVRRILGEDT